MKVFLHIAFSLIMLPALAGKTQEPPYSVPDTPWAEAYGNHRAIIQVPGKADVATVDLLWRRHDPHPETKRLLIVNSQTGDTVRNIFRYVVNNERCRIAFGPVNVPGYYYFYYLPYSVQTDWGFFSNDYFPREPEPDGEWVLRNQVDRTSRFKSFLPALPIGFQSRTAFDSFYPMEIIPLAAEKKEMLEKYDQDWLVFPEDRRFPVRMKDEIPLSWVRRGPVPVFKGEACRNEYYAFQIGLYAVRDSLQDLRVEFSPLKGRDAEIPVSSMTCFNTGGIGPYGRPFVKNLGMAEGSVQPLWIGIDIPGAIAPGSYSGSIVVRSSNAGSRKIDITINILDTSLADRGDSETWRHSRLRWLNSTLGIDDKPVKPYSPVELHDGYCRMTDKTMTVAANGLPGSINISGTELLRDKVSFIIATEKGDETFSGLEDPELLKDEPGVAQGTWHSRSRNFSLTGTATVESDGYLNYRIRIRALNSTGVSDIRLEIPFRSDIARYMIGMGLPGSEVPGSHEAKWRGPFDSFWIGNAGAGLWCELRGAAYTGPLLNLYHPAPPGSWYNDDRGGFRIIKEKEDTRAVVYSGGREFSQGEEITFEWSMLITPVKKINYRSQFNDRYYHNGGNPMPSDADMDCGVKIVNLHHANNYNPHINYPFIAVDSMKWFVNQLHGKGKKVKIYYTIRELTNYTTEIWALRSLGNEILGDGSGGGYPWLREHFITGYRPQWYQHFPDKSPDASVVNAPGDSRWYNYYIEGLAWLVKNVDIDGLYLDDVTYDRRTVKRIRKVLDNTKPGCLLDLHSNTGFSIGPANQYAEYFPYIDKIWFGESFQYDKMSPANWLVETSGIPFGLMGDMLQGGGNRWLGMIYGMTVRHPWLTEGVTCDPRPVWAVWDKFGIENAEMKGYWENDCPVTTSDPEVLATVYQREGSALVALGSWAATTTSFRLSIDWEKLGIEPSRAVIEAPYILNFQDEQKFRPGEVIQVEPKKGRIILIYATGH